MRYLSITDINSSMTKIGFHYKSMQWFLYDKDLRHERVKYNDKIKRNKSS